MLSVGRQHARACYRRDRPQHAADVHVCSARARNHNPIKCTTITRRSIQHSEYCQFVIRFVLSVAGGGGGGGGGGRGRGAAAYLTATDLCGESVGAPLTAGRPGGP